MVESFSCNILICLPKKTLRFSFCHGLRDDLSRRWKYYKDDYLDGVRGERTLFKVSSTILTLLFSILLPCLAFGMLDKLNTKDMIGPKEALLGQAIGGLLFAIFGGQPLVIIATTAPLCLFTTIVYQISYNLGVQFLDLFAAVGLWNTVFLVLYAVFDLSKLMHLCTRSTEEIFATFIFFAFTIDALRECVKSMCGGDVVDHLLSNCLCPRFPTALLFQWNVEHFLQGSGGVPSRGHHHHFRVVLARGMLTRAGPALCPAHARLRGPQCLSLQFWQDVRLVFIFEKIIIVNLFSPPDLTLPNWPAMSLPIIVCPSPWSSSV